MIYVKGLSKSYGDNQVIRNIDMHIAPGEKVVIIGPSGSGKSTFLRCLNLLEQPTSGSIVFDGNPWNAYDGTASDHVVCSVGKRQIHRQQYDEMCDSGIWN